VDDAAAQQGSPRIGEGDILDQPAAGPLAIRGGALRAASYIAGVAASVAAAALMTRHLGVVDYGRFVIAGSIVAFVTAFAEAGLSNIGLRELSVRPPEAARRFLANLIGLRLTLACIGLAAATGFAVIARYDSSIIAGSAVLGLAMLATLLQGTYTIPLQSALRLTSVSILDFVRQGGTAVAVVVLVLAGAGLVPFFVAPVAGALLALLATLPVARRLAPWRPAFDAGEWRAMLRDTLPVAAATVVGAIYYRVAIIVLSLVASETETGYFSASFRVIEVLVLVPGLLLTSAFPILARAARDDRGRLGYAVTRLFETSLLLGVAVALGVVTLAPLAIDIVAGAEFEESIQPLRIQGVSLAATFLVATLGFALLSLRRHREIVAANAIALVAAGVLSLVLGEAHGADGAAIAMTVTECLLAAVYAVFVVRAGGLSLPLGVTWKVTLAAGAAAGAALLTDLAVVPTGALTLLVYFAGLLILRAIPEEIWHAIGLRRG
jgi:O-antigen/teichoic acid export membrane protein